MTSGLHKCVVSSFSYADLGHSLWIFQSIDTFATVYGNRYEHGQQMFWMVVLGA